MKSPECLTDSRSSDENNTRIHWQYRSAAAPAFDVRMFNDGWLAEQQYIVNSPTAGRGASLFLSIDAIDLVLRHYRRGGMVRTISEQSYIWQGLERTRAWREFAVLCELERQKLPAPRPYACQVQHRGWRYGASLITYYLAGVTLAEHVCTAALPDAHWRSIGQCIRRFHNAGVDHADLNAHNILLDNGRASLIDFDRAVISSLRGPKPHSKNMQRLKRSLNKIGSSGPAFYNEDCWTLLNEGYLQT